MTDDEARVVSWAKESGIPLQEEIYVFNRLVEFLESIPDSEDRTIQKVSPSISEHLKHLRSAHSKRA